jgi:hypothetical protein
LSGALTLAGCLGVCIGPGAALGAAPGDTPRSFAEALAAAGWQVEVLVDGSLLLTPRANARPQAPDVTPGPAGEPDGGWDALESFGWRVETDTDGATLLYPPSANQAPAAMPPPMPASTPRAQATPPQQGVAPPPETQAPSPRGALAQQLDTLLAERGWRTQWEADGSLLLLPLGQTLPRVRPAAGVVPGAVTGGQVDLPLDTPAEVRSVAASWLAAIGDPRLFPGQIYAVAEIYLVNILSSTPPHDLRHQIAIRATDGRVVVLN